MKRFIGIALTLLIAAYCANTITGQSKFTPYDDLPTIIKSYKPAYSHSYPDWAKMLYQYPVNFNDIDSSFEKYMKEHKGEKNAIIRYFKIWRQAVGDFVDVDGTIQLPNIHDLNIKIKQEQIKAFNKLKSAAETNYIWSFLGPKETFWLNKDDAPEAPGSCPWQVNVYSFDVAKTNDSILFAGTETGFVNKTVDKGHSWQLLAREYPFGGGVSAVAIDPVDPDVVYVSAGKQMHKTTDGGITWKPLLPAASVFYANRLKIAEDDRNKIVAAAAEGVFVSFDGGTTWQKKWSSSSWDVDFMPGNTNIVYALSVSDSGYFQFLISTDGGNNFSVVSSFPSTIKEGSGGLLAVTPANNTVVFVTMLATENDDGVPFFYTGTYDGTDFTWVLTKKGDYRSSAGLRGFSTGQGYFDLVFEVSPVDEKIVFWGTCSLFKSVDGGYNYAKIGGYGGDFKIHPDMQDMKMLPNGDTWVTTDGGVNYTTDNFNSQANYHVRIEGLIGSAMWGFDQGWNEDIVVGGRYHNGNTAMTDFYGDKALMIGGGESPTGWVLQGYSRHVAFNDSGKGWILPKTAEGTYEGRFVFSKYPNMDEYGGRRGNLIHHPNYYDILYLGEGNSIWRSMDAGMTYDMLHTFPDRVRYLQISFSDPDIIYVDIVKSGLFKSEDGGLTWIRKKSLTDGSYADASWKGKLFFAISPYDGNVIYACLNNNRYPKNGKVFRSVDGGNTWTDWTAGLENYTKCLVVQPTTDGVDLVYLFNTSKNGVPASVYYRRADGNSWTEYDSGFPLGMKVNLALPFFRDSKLRVAGGAGVWESPFQEPDFTPVVNPWCQKKEYKCGKDTVFFDDHSMVNHDGTTWHWDFNPEPKYISNPDIRNPKVVFGDTIAKSYDVTVTISKGGETYIRTITDMVSFTPCPSIYDCNYPAEIAKSEMTVIGYDCQHSDDRSAEKAIDGDVGTFWQTKWNTSYTYPHYLEVDMGESYMAHKFIYFPRQDGKITGNIGNYELYMSTDNTNWGAPVKTGTYEESSSPKTIEFDTPIEARYFRFVALSEVNDAKVWCAVAEFTVVGCLGSTGIFENHYEEISAWPVPTDGKVNLSLFKNAGQDMEYTLFSVSGQAIDKGLINGNSSNFTIDLARFSKGIYFIVLVDKQGVKYRVKVVKK